MLKNKWLNPITNNVSGLYYLQLLVAAYTLVFYFDQTGLIITAISYFCFGSLGVEINSHRYWSHRSFEYRYKWMEWVFSWFGTLSGTGSPMQWVAIHHDHHQHSDKDGDPHNPNEKGLSMLLWLVYPKANPYKLRYMIKDNYQCWLHRNFMLVFLITWLVLYLIGGFWLVAYAAIIPSALVTLIQVGTTYICHVGVGYRNYDTDDESRNVWWWAILDFGEGLHNTHHAQPWRWNLKDKWWEIDISAIVIRIVGKNLK